MHRLLLLPVLVTLLPGQDHWPQFRGPGGMARAGAARSLKFDKQTDLRYRVPIPAGASSPCIFGDRIFLTGKEGDELVMFALARETGEELWRHAVPAPKPQEYGHKDGGVALPTPCTNGERVFFYFPEHGLSARTMDGGLAWAKVLQSSKTSFGIGSSPALCGDLLILLRDGCPERTLYAFDEKTGKEVWTVPRPRSWQSHTTPFVWRNTQRTEIVIASSGALESFDPKDGKELWRVGGLTPLVCTTPTASRDRLFFAAWSSPSAVSADRFLDGIVDRIELSEKERKEPAALFERLDKNGDGKLVPEEVPAGRVRDAWRFLDRSGDGAIQRQEFLGEMNEAPVGENVMISIDAGGAGDITKTHVKWTVRRGIPYVASPLLHDGVVILAKAGGVIGGYDAATGKQVIRRGRLSDHSEYYASPIAVGDKVIACASAGTLFVLDPANQLEEVTTVDFGEPLFATPAVVDGVVYVRTNVALYAFGK